MIFIFEFAYTICSCFDPSAYNQ